MSTQVDFGFWVSIVSDKMVDGWVKKKYIPSRDVLLFSENGDDGEFKHGDIIHRLSMRDNDGKVLQGVDDAGEEYYLSEWVRSEDKSNELKALGYKSDDYERLVIDSKIYNRMRGQVGKWYDKIFDDVEKWLRKSGLMHISKGSIKTGFCVESNPDHEVVKNWGAPLAKKENKVIQMKEKFGRIVVYFMGLTEEEREKVDKFALDVEAKYDCTCDFI